MPTIEQVRRWEPAPCPPISFRLPLALHADGLDRTADHADHGHPLGNAEIAALRNIGGLLRRHAANTDTVRKLLAAAHTELTAKP